MSKLAGWLPELATDFTPQGTICEKIVANAAKHPTKPFAVVLLPERAQIVSYSDLVEQARRYCAWFTDRGVREGDVIAFMTSTDAQIFAAFTGSMLAGAVPSIFPAMSSKQNPNIFWTTHQKVFDRIKPALILTDDVNLELLNTYVTGFEDRTASISQVPLGRSRVLTTVRVVPESTAFLQHSSGTTGLKKGVELSHQSVLAQVSSYARCLDINDEDLVASWLPLYHDMGLIACFMLPCILGLTTVHLDPFEWALRPWTFLDAIESYRATLSWMPNFAFQHIARAAPRSRNWDLSSLRAIINCSEPCKPSTFETFLSRFRSCGLRADTMQVCYAMAENVFAVTQTTLGKIPRVTDVGTNPGTHDSGAYPSQTVPSSIAIEKYLSCGRPIQGTRVRVVDHDGRVLPDARIGQIQISGTSLFSGYHLVANTQSISNDWYSTGDLGFMTAGELYVTGRKDDLLIIRGKNLYAHDVEFAVSVLEGAVKPGRAVAFGISNEVSGSQDLVIVGERHPGNTPERDVDIIRSIKEVVFSSTGVMASDARLVEQGWLVKTTSGKISREANAKKYLAELVDSG